MAMNYGATVLDVWDTEESFELFWGTEQVAGEGWR